LNPISNQPSTNNPYFLQTQEYTPTQKIGAQSTIKEPSPVKAEVAPNIKTIYSEKTLKRMGIIECSTCANRTYQDGSNDPGVSFKAPTHISPASSGSAVRSHEQEHVVREQANARENGGEVISQSVSIHISICPECGRSYTSGGLTRTTTKYSGDSDASCKGGLLDLSV